MSEKVQYFSGDIATPVMRFEKLLPSAQGMAIYSDILFQLFHTGKCALFDLQTKCEKPLAFFPLGSSNDGDPDNNYLNHSNQCMFGQKHIGSNPLPLLYVTSGYGIGADENGFYYRCAVENITLSHDDKGNIIGGKSELLQTVSYRNDGIENTPYEDPCWGCPAWFADDEHGYMYIFSTRWRTKKEFLQYYDQNRFRITKLRMPDLTEGNFVVLTAADIVDQFLMPFDILFTQGGMICGDKLFYTFGCGDALDNAYPNGLRVYDLTNKCLVASADLSGTCFAAEEIESAYFYNGELLVNTNAKPTGGIYSLGRDFASLL